MFFICSVYEDATNLSAESRTPSHGQRAQGTEEFSWNDRYRL